MMNESSAAWKSQSTGKTNSVNAALCQLWSESTFWGRAETLMVGVKILRAGEEVKQREIEAAAIHKKTKPREFVSDSRLP
jgi:hypothetical protein